MLGNAAAAAVLAVFAAILSYFVRAPAVRHAAWVLVLLKLVTPPVVSLPLPVLPAVWGPQPEPAEAEVGPPSRGGPLTGRVPLGSRHLLHEAAPGLSLKDDLGL